MSDELKKLIADVIDQGPDAKPSMVEIGRLFTNHISTLTGSQIHIFIYFTDIQARSIACAFYCEGKFPIENYEGVCSVHVESAGIVSSSCDLLPFVKGERVSWTKYPETYINVNLEIDENYNLRIEDVFWTGDVNGEWEYMSKPRTHLYENLEYIYDDY